MPTLTRESLDEELVRQTWATVVPPDEMGRINLGVMTYHSRSRDPEKAWARLAAFTTDLLNKAKELQSYIDQIQKEIDVNSNGGTSVNPKSETYWAEKNARWRGMIHRFQLDLNYLTWGMKGWKKDVNKGGQRP